MANPFNMLPKQAVMVKRVIVQTRAPAALDGSVSSTSAWGEGSIDLYDAPPFFELISQCREVFDMWGVKHAHTVVHGA